MTELCEIALRCRTDKAGSYTTFYDTLFSQRRREIEKVLEIGIGSMETMTHVKDYVIGASLFMWREYFPNATIFGVDNDTRLLFEGERIKTMECDQHKRADLLRVAQWAGGSFDLIVDDGDHTVQGQLLSVTTLVPYLAIGGVYIVEDTHKPEELSAVLPFEHAVISYKYTPALTGRLIMIRNQ